MNFRAITRIGLLLLSLTLCSGAALAYTGKGIVTKIPSALNVSLERQTDKTGEAILRLSAPVSYTGCPRVSNLEHTIDIAAGQLDIEVTKFTINFRNLPNAAGAPCNQAFQRAAADIPLDRKLIEDNQIKVISISIPGGLPSQIYDVTLEAQKLSITPRPSTIPEIGRGFYTQQLHYSRKQVRTSSGVPIEFWYYPKNTIILSAPIARGEARAKIVDDFAIANDLVVLNTVLEGFDPTLGESPNAGQDRVYYYIDERNRLNADATGKVVGKSGDVDIYARTPNKYE